MPECRQAVPGNGGGEVVFPVIGRDAEWEKNALKAKRQTPRAKGAMIRCGVPTVFAGALDEI